MRIFYTKIMRALCARYEISVSVFFKHINEILAFEWVYFRHKKENIIFTRTLREYEEKTQTFSSIFILRAMDK